MAGSHIAMHVALLVQRLQGGGDLDSQGDDRLGGQRRGARGLERATVEALGDEEPASLVGPEAAHHQQVRMVEP
ncbi:MAG: hypothetical protein JRJ84_05780 [Deltaproteobacteria bacterium]|nr:hypothetical protein [Deltaproteobacteria bacterium]